jgi:hypothetical protein
VLKRRFPGRLNKLSDRAEGSTQPTRIRTLVGTIEGPNGDVDIIVERMNRGTLIPLYLFSSKTLRSIPDLYAEVNRTAVETAIPRCSTETSSAAIRLFSWIAVLHGSRSRRGPGSKSGTVAVESRRAKRAKGRINQRRVRRSKAVRP